MAISSRKPTHKPKMHSEITPYSYGGFRTWGDTVPSTLKPGETLENRANKFQNVGHGAVYRDLPPREVARDVSNQGLTLRNVKPSDYKIPDKRGLSVQWAAEARPSKPFLGTTTYEATFVKPEGADDFKVKEPEWLSMSKKTHPDPLPRHPTQLTTGYRTDFGIDPENDKPFNKSYMYKSGMDGSSNDLGEGTSKQSFHLPGYGGHIPANRRNPVAALHADAEEVRDKGSNLRMYHRHNMVGYTGFAPRDASNDVGEMTCGANPATTSGAANLNLML
mmetsp:Transcript_14111/g.18337  ORF Transcript_14111/g.18337 Transcript_14111/m.18337 type:complete len:277 (+) Transcript_14111:8-838(+)